uniref:WGS project CAEQ00000000 data, annotated contig 397 n=1 Tax=Trypanosoma congolense (strain IL3000) TaxID=1068625 RepID=F9WFK5_TRYCI|nr:unnamed protein product [Trypanosoma congolense IL3000]
MFSLNVSPALSWRTTLCTPICAVLLFIPLLITADSGEKIDIFHSGDVTEDDSGLEVGYETVDYQWSVILSLVVIFGPQIGYIFQLYEIKSRGVATGYSPLVSVILLLSNALRILYFVGHSYAVALLFQSIISLPVHMVLVLSVLRYSASSGENSGGSRADDVQVSGGDAHDFSHRVTDAKPSFVTRILQGFDNFVSGMEESVSSSSTSDFTQYSFLYGLVITVSILLYYAAVLPFWRDAPQLVGYTALVLEATLLIPQIMRNYRRGSTKGLSLVLFATWVIGDIAKLVYFIVFKQPVPFLVCSGIQLALDVIVGVQVVVYRCCSRRSGPSLHEVNGPVAPGGDVVITAAAEPPAKDSWEGVVVNGKNTGI